VHLRLRKRKQSYKDHESRFVWRNALLCCCCWLKLRIQNATVANIFSNFASKREKNFRFLRFQIAKAEKPINFPSNFRVASANNEVDSAVTVAHIPTFQSGLNLAFDGPQQIII